MIRFHNCDCMDFMRDQPDKAFELAIVDPPYEYRGDFFIYVLARELHETHDRIMRLSSIDRRIIPFCQPYRDFAANQEPSVALQRLARWCNVQSIRKSVKFKDYKG